MNDYYTILNVKRSANQNEIKKSFKKLARKCHPDKNPTDKLAEQKFKELSEAYETLIDPKKKEIYDNRMNFSFDYNRWGQAFGNKSTATSFKSPLKKEKPKGNNLKITIDLTLKEICTGVTKLIKIKRTGICPACDGTGAKNTCKCSNCGGVGAVRTIQKTSLFGNSIVIDNCIRCEGSGIEIKEPCLNCQGSSVVKEESSINLKIPPLVNNFILSGEGDAGNKGGPKGDLHVQINEITDLNFERKDNDLYTNVEVNISDLVLGNIIRVPTLFGSVDMKIPAGHQPHINLGIKGKGLAEHSYLFVKLKLIIPTSLNEEQTKLFEKLRELENIIKI